VVNPGPYSQNLEPDGCIHRVFAAGVDDLELKWHRDDRDRVVTVVSGRGWSLQLEGGLPVPLTPGYFVAIPRLGWHRLISEGSEDLHVRIREL
jgi:quercetin dioxygenase-like cupin family protein